MFPEAGNCQTCPEQAQQIRRQAIRQICRSRNQNPKRCQNHVLRRQKMPIHRQRLHSRTTFNRSCHQIEDAGLAPSDEITFTTSRSTNDLKNDTRWSPPTFLHAGEILPSAILSPSVNADHWLKPSTLTLSKLTRSEPPKKD